VNSSLVTTGSRPERQRKNRHRENGVGAAGRVEELLNQWVRLSRHLPIFHRSHRSNGRDRQDRSASCFTETCQYRNRNRLWKTAKYNPVPKRNRRPTGDQALHLLNCCGDENTWTKGGVFVGLRPQLQFGREVGKLEPQIEHLQWSPKMGSDWGETEPGRGRRSYDFSYRVA
jgi:hypothetical protein